MTGLEDGRASPDAGDQARASAASAILVVLVLATVFSYIDRTLLSLLLAPIQRDMRIGDLQASYLLGPTFAIFFAVMGVPLGRAADHFDRLRLAAVGVALWSAATALSGLAHEFWQLFIGRIGVAVGEAVLLPTASSLIADAFPERLRTRAMGVLGMAIYWGSGLALLVGGLIINAVGRLADASGQIAGHRPWQVVMMLVGAPGLLIAAALALLPEPARRVSMATAIEARAGGPHDLRRSLEYGFLFLAFGLMAVIGYSLLSWAPSHLVRAYGWTAGQAGVGLGLGSLVATTSAIGLASAAADRLGARGRADAKSLVAGVSAVSALPATLAIGLVHQPLAFVAAACFAMGAAAACIAIGPAAVVEISSPRRRGRAIGAYQMVVGFIGAGIGPPAVAVVAKLSVGAPGGLGSALSKVSTAGFLVAAAIFWGRRKAFASATRARGRARLD